MLNLQNAFFHFNSIRRTNHLMCAGLRSIQGLISFFHASLPNNEKLNLLKHFDLGSLGPLQISPGLQNESDYDRRPTMTHDPSSIDAESRRANERRLAATRSWHLSYLRNTGDCWHRSFKSTAVVW